MSHKQIYYSDKYDDEKYEYRCVLLMLRISMLLYFYQDVSIILQSTT